MTPPALALPCCETLNGIDFEVGSFATFGHRADDVAGLVRFARLYFVAAFGIPANSENIRVHEEQLCPRR